MSTIGKLKTRAGARVHSVIWNFQICIASVDNLVGGLGVGGRRGLVVASGSVQTESTVGEELADERVGGKADGDAVRVLEVGQGGCRIDGGLTQERHLEIG